MAYIEKEYKTPWGIEHVLYWEGNYGGKGEKREKRKKATPEQIRKQNQKNKENRIRRIINANFVAGDWWITLKYPKGTRKSIEEVDADVNRFTRIMRERYKKLGIVFKWVKRVEIGRHGGIHVHMVINRADDPKNDLSISDAWIRARRSTQIEDLIDGYYPADGMAHLDHVRTVGNGQELAEYIAKEQPAVLDDGTELTKAQLRRISHYGCSRNLIRPVPQEKRYSHWTVRRILELGASGLNSTQNRYRTEGYIVDQESWVQGINPVTGLSYLHYFEVPARRKRE